MKALRIIFLITLSFAMACESAPRTGVEIPPIPSPLPSLQAPKPMKGIDSQLYSALLSHLVWDERFVAAPLIIINDHTVGPDKIGQLKSDDRISQETLNDYRSNNQQSFKLHCSFDVYANYVCKPKEQIPPLDSEEFRAKYHGAKGVISFSRIGFNQDWTQAFVHVEYSCLPDCSDDSYWLLNLRDGIWKIQRLDYAEVR